MKKKRYLLANSDSYATEFAGFLQVVQLYHFNENILSHVDEKVSLLPVRSFNCGHVANNWIE